MRKVIIDTDTAGDDTIALLTALHHFKVEALRLGWDMCTEYSIMDDGDHQDIEKMATAGSNFFMKINKVVLKFNKEVHRLYGTNRYNSRAIVYLRTPQVYRLA